MSLSKKFSDALSSHGYPLGHEWVTSEEVRAKFIVDNIKEITEAFRLYDERVSKAKGKTKGQSLS